MHPHDEELLETMGNVISATRFLLNQNAPSPQTLIAYVGTSQYKVMAQRFNTHHLDPRNEDINPEWLGAEIIRVMKSNYFHVVPRG